MRFYINFKVLFVLFCILFPASSVIAEDVTKPHTFSAGTPASASEVNADFDVLYEEINKLRGEIDELKQTNGLPPADYDSGWFQISKNKTYEDLKHNIGELPILIVGWKAKDNQGSNLTANFGRTFTDSTTSFGFTVKNITTTSYDITTGSQCACNNTLGCGSCYIRVLMWK